MMMELMGIEFQIFRGEQGDCIADPLGVVA